MIEIRDTHSDGLIEIRMVSPVTEDDYKTTLVPAIDAALAKHDRVRLLAVIEAKISDFTLGAIFQDSRLGLKHWRGFDRVAVVTDNSIIAASVSAFSIFMPCPVMKFDMDEQDEARRWLRESLGSIHQEDLGNGILHLSLLGKVDSAAYDTNIEDLDDYFAAHEQVRLLIDLREFDGWQGLDALRDHFHLVRGHSKKVARAAIVGDAGWQEMAVQLGKRAIGMDAKYFDEDDLDDAKKWLAS